MKHRTLEQGLELVRKFRASGSRQERFARRRRIKVATLRYWLRRSKQVDGDGRAPMRFVELKPDQDQEDIHISIETLSVIVRLNRLPSADYLVELILGIGRA